MARDESNREDLLREATALVERIELVPKSATEGEHIVAGFRRDGALSIFFGENRVYQFNASGELRRAYRDGKLLKAVSGRLAELQRVRMQTEVQLVRHELSSEEEAAFITEMKERLRYLTGLIDAKLFEVVGQVSADVDVLSRVKKYLATHDTAKIAAQPNV